MNMIKLAAILVLASGISPALASPPNGPITDSSGNVWAINQGHTTRNGVSDTDSGNVHQLMYSHGKIYKEQCAWYMLSSGEWPAGNNGWKIQPTAGAVYMHSCPPANRKSP